MLQKIFDQFPVLEFTIRDTGLSNPLDVVGNNVVYTRWDGIFENRYGRTAQLSGVTVATLRYGRVKLIEDIFDATSEQHRRSWMVE